MTNYFVQRGTKSFGPLAAGKVLSLIKAGKILPTDAIATDKNGPWKPVAEVPALKAALGQGSVESPAPATGNPAGTVHLQGQASGPNSDEPRLAPPPLAPIRESQYSKILPPPKPSGVKKPDVEKESFSDSLLFRSLMYIGFAAVLGGILFVVGSKINNAFTDAEDRIEVAGDRLANRLFENQQKELAKGIGERSGNQESKSRGFVPERRDRVVPKVVPKVVPSLAKTKIVQIGAGKATITDKKSNGRSHVKIECNNGLVIDADWQRNSFNDFGYDIYEPTVSMDYNRLAVMATARGVIASYLRGEYD